jgi:uncharacterized protein YneR
MSANYDDLAIFHDPLDMWYFTGAANMEAAIDYMHSHAQGSFTHSAIFTPNEDGVGARADEQTVWFMFVDHDLPTQYFTKYELTPDGIVRRDAMRAEKAAAIQASIDALKNLPLIANT